VLRLRLFYLFLDVRFIWSDGLHSKPSEAVLRVVPDPGESEHRSLHRMVAIDVTPWPWFGNYEDDEVPGWVSGTKAGRNHAYAWKFTTLALVGTNTLMTVVSLLPLYTRVAAYVRVSARDQSLDRQLESTHEYSQHEFDTLPVETYRDTATGTDIDRDGFHDRRRI
jgi:hypothetical protein